MIPKLQLAQIFASQYQRMIVPPKLWLYFPLVGIGKRQKGEAVVVEVSTGKHLFALLGKPHPLPGLIQTKEIG